MAPTHGTNPTASSRTSKLKQASTRLDPLHAMQFRAAEVVQVSGMCPESRPSRSDRDYPLDTDGDRCLWHVGGTAGTNDDARAWQRRLQRGRSVRPVSGDPCIVGKSRQAHPDLRASSCIRGTLARATGDSGVGRCRRHAGAPREEPAHRTSERLTSSRVLHRRLRLIIDKSSVRTP
jgi:hypothetical protein